MRTRVAALLAGLPLLVVLAGCGGGGTRAAAPAVLNPQTATDTLRAHGWQVRPVAGMPNTASGVHQVAYLELTTPDGFGIDAQYLDTATDATTELAAAEQQMAGCRGTTIDNAMVFSRSDGRQTIPTTTLDELRSLLRST